MIAFELSSYHTLLAGIGGCIMLAYWVPRLFGRNEPAASALVILLGAAVFHLVPQMPSVEDPLDSAVFWEVASELAVITALFGSGLRIDSGFDIPRLTPTFRLLILAMPLTVIGVATAGWFIGGLTLGGAIILGAVLAPTDPVLAGDLQVGPPQEGREHPVRYTLTTEAGLNDGLAFPFLYLGMIVLAQGWAPQQWGLEWLGRDVFYRIAVGVVSGAAVGWLIGKLVFVFPRNNRLAEKGAGVIALAAVLFCYGATELLEGYGFISAFVAGAVLRRVESDHQYHRKLHDFTEAAEHAISALLLFLLGAALPMLFKHLTLPLVGVSLLLIFVIRPLVGWLTLIGTQTSGADRALVAFYGVRGIGSIYYLAFATTHAELAQPEALWATMALCVLLSTIVHGFTAGAIDRRLAIMERVGRAARRTVRGDRRPPSEGTPT